MTKPPIEDPEAKVRRFRAALDLFVERLEEDRYVLAAVLVGSLNEVTIWRKESLHLWIIEADGVTRRLRSDGDEERIFRTFAEAGINIHAELIPRSRFKRMVEGSSRTAFSHSFFAVRSLVHTKDPSIDQWFEDANRLGTRDQQKELFVAATYAMHAHREAEKYLLINKDLELARQSLLWAAWSLAAIRIIEDGEVHEEEIIYRALERDPDLFKVVYSDIVGTPAKKAKSSAALAAVLDYLNAHAERYSKPLLSYLKKQGRVVALSELADHFAHTQIYPWHVQQAGDWLERHGRLEKVSAPFKLTKRSQIEIEEPAYYLDS